MTKGEWLEEYNRWIQKKYNEYRDDEAMQELCDVKAGACLANAAMALDKPLRP